MDRRNLFFLKRTIIFEELRRRESYQVRKLVHYLDSEKEYKYKGREVVGVRIIRACCLLAGWL
jgi:hypothetical protein